MFVLTLLVHFALALLAAIGPLFVCFALFDFSRNWFFAWLGTILNFALVKLLILVLITMVINLLGNIGAAASGLDAAAAFAIYGVGFVCAIILFFIVPSIAASLSAGAQLSTGFIQRSVERRAGLRGGSSGGHRSGSGQQSGTITKSSN
jgi:type IV secretion system protein VirB6